MIRAESVTRTIKLKFKTMMLNQVYVITVMRPQFLKEP